MKILEILLPKNIKDRDLSPKHAQKIDTLQKRMNGYIDKICKPGTAPAAVEFLKAKLKDDYHELKSVFKEVAKESVIQETEKKAYDPNSKTYMGEPMPTLDPDVNDYAEPFNDVNDTTSIDINDIDRKKIIARYMKLLNDDERTGVELLFYEGLGIEDAAEKMGMPPEDFKLMVRRALARIRHITQHGKGQLPDPRGFADNTGTRGEFSYGWTPGMTPFRMYESVRKLPLSNADFELVKELMSNPIPAVVAPIYIQEIIDDDEFSDMLREFEETKPAMDIRPYIVDWFKRVMPDQMHRFYGGQTTKQREGIMSPIHGYDPHMYHGSSESITPNGATGRIA